jgi:hypothetical protein
MRDKLVVVGSKKKKKKTGMQIDQLTIRLDYFLALRLAVWGYPLLGELTKDVSEREKMSEGG